MNCKSLFFLVVFSLTLISGVFAQKKVSILGDSYSTFYGHVSPAANLCWYGVPGEKKENDVTKVEETWWYRFIHEHGFQLERNNSYSGSTVCHTGYEKADYSDRSFITRIHNLGTPDIILVFGGTNDSWAGAPIGAYQYDGWTKADLYSFRPAFCYLLASLKQLYPAARIYNITNSELSEEVTDSMDEICRHYGIENIRLHDIDKQWGHPSVQGMQSIDAQVWESVSRYWRLLFLCLPRTKDRSHWELSFSILNANLSTAVFFSFHSCGKKRIRQWKESKSLWQEK